ncbi:MAG: glycosyltransferase, partial [Bacteroidaceae bacterium]|nr:glycosyltransferase [Bacteroidaceae bacterium]
MNNNKPKVSLITTCRNRANTIENTILSVLGQDYPNIEYIIIDGLSKDGSVEIIRKYQDKIAEFVSEPDGGVYNAINKGIKLATGDIIGLVHSDDKLYETSTISRVVELFNYSDADLIYANGIYSNAKGVVRRVWYSGPFDKCKVRFG